MLAPLDSTVDIEEHEKYLFMPLYGNMEDLSTTTCTPKVNEPRGKGVRVNTLCFQCCLTF